VGETVHPTQQAVVPALRIASIFRAKPVRQSVPADRFDYTLRFGIQFDIDVDRLISETEQQSGRAACEIDSAGGFSSSPELLHEFPQALGGDFAPHDAL
jgi:hypothetical protein